MLPGGSTPSGASTAGDAPGACADATGDADPTGESDRAEDVAPVGDDGVELLANPLAVGDGEAIAVSADRFSSSATTTPVATAPTAISVMTTSGVRLSDACRRRVMRVTGSLNRSR